MMRPLSVSLPRPLWRTRRVAPSASSGSPHGGLFSSLIAVAAVGMSSLVAVAVLTASGSVERPVGRAVVHALAITAPAATGLYAVRSGYARFGWQLIAAGFVWSLTILAESSSSVAYSAGRVVAWLLFPLLFFLMLAYPEGRIVVRRDRLLLMAITAVVGVLYIGSALLVEAYPASTPWTSCGADCPPNAFQIVSREPGWVDSVFSPARDLVSCLLLVGVTGVLAVRLRAASPIERVTTGPVLGASIVATAVVVAFIVTRRVAPDTQLVRSIGLAWMLCLPAIAAAFSFGLVRRRLFLSGVLSRMSRSLTAPVEPSQIPIALRSTVGGSPLELLLRDPAHERWVREDGSVAEPGEVPGPGRALREIDDGSGPIAAIEMDAGLVGDAELSDAIVSLVKAALRESRLKVDLQTSLSDLDDSRRRLATAADAERRRIERDLHDGAQQRLIALRMRLSLAEDLLREDSAAASAAIRGLGEDVDHALEEIRSLAHGIYPPLLADRGLPDALRSVARRSMLRVDIRAAGLSRQAPEVEAAVYFACREALQNAAKHADGSERARILLDQGRRHLTFEVTDHGEGFDPEVARAGTGLRNMRDRIESVGGTLTILSSAGRGTTVSGRVPLPGGLRG